jgi:polar amino acid transport system substrate-binding protein
MRLWHGICIGVLVATTAMAQGAGQRTPQAGAPLASALDGTFAPHAMPKLGGGIEGFNVDLAEEIGRRLGRPVTIDSLGFAGLIPALNAGRYDFIAAPTTVTAQRSQNLLFSEPYLDTNMQFVVLRGVTLTSLEQLRGQTISVNKGSLYDTWAQANAERYGFRISAFDTQTDAIQDVIARRSFANLAGNTALAFAVRRLPALQLGLEIETGQYWSIPVRRDNPALRDDIDWAIECMKRDGVIARLYEKWFGVAPRPGAAAVTLFAGRGTPGFDGYDPTPQSRPCG